MSFAQYDYLPFLLFVLAAFQFVPARLRVVYLLAASYAFYAAWSLPFVALLWLSTVVDWFLAKGIHRSENQRHRKMLLTWHARSAA